MKNSRFIPVAEPSLNGNEKKYVLDCLDSTWISSKGRYIDKFENEFAKFCQADHAISCTNGTVALHLALLALGVGPGDEVIVPTLTFVATANAVSYCNAIPVFIDSKLDTWNIDPSLIENKINERTKGIVVVHLYGQPADMDPILEIAQKHDLFVIEDAAEAHGAEYKNNRVGSIGHVGTFSFYGNKVITCGEGGMVTTNDNALASRIRQLKGQGLELGKRYWFPIVGFNYRMTNIAAAIGLAQLENVEWHLRRRREIAKAYTKNLKNISCVKQQIEEEYLNSVYWMNSIILDEAIPIHRDDFMKELAASGIETRPIFYPMHMLPMYEGLSMDNDFPIADRVSKRGINLPSHANLTKSDVDYVCDKVKMIIEEAM